MNYKEQLQKNILAFWIENGIDKENGGIFTCLDEKGKLYGKEKSVWFQDVRFEHFPKPIAYTLKCGNKPHPINLTTLRYPMSLVYVIMVGYMGGGYASTESLSGILASFIEKMIHVNTNLYVWKIKKSREQK